MVGVPSFLGVRPELLKLGVVLGVIRLLYRGIVVVPAAVPARQAVQPGTVRCNRVAVAPFTPPSSAVSKGVGIESFATEGGLSWRPRYREDLMARTGAYSGFSEEDAEFW